MGLPNPRDEAKSNRGSVKEVKSEEPIEEVKQTEGQENIEANTSQPLVIWESIWPLKENKLLFIWTNYVAYQWTMIQVYKYKWIIRYYDDCFNKPKLYNNYKTSLY